MQVFEYRGVVEKAGSIVYARNHKILRISKGV